MSSGWIKLHRQLLDWEWYDDINTTRLFVHLLLRANHKDNNWRGKEIKRGQLYTSLDSLSKETKLTVKQIRTSLNKLISTSEVASKGQATGRMITMVNYDSYQDEGKPEGNQGANQGQAKGNKQECKKEKNENKYSDQFEFFWSGYPKKVDKNKAEKAFNAKVKKLNLNKDGVNEFIEFMHSDLPKRYANTEKQYIPNAATYLNGERWQDEL